MLVLSVLCGLVAGVMVVIAREWLDPTIRYENDVERALDVPVLAGLLDSNEILGLPDDGSRRPTRPSLPSPTV
jgi:capsular polysaccharide biosynthesis protein